MNFGVTNTIKRLISCHTLAGEAVALILFCSIAAQVPGAEESGKASPEIGEMILNFLLSEETTPANELKAGGMRTITAIEDFLDQRNHALTNEVPNIVSRLKDLDAQTRERALREVVPVSGAAVQLVEADWKKCTDNEEKNHLLVTMNRVSDIEDRLRDLVGLLQDLYGEHLDRIFSERWTRLRANVQDLKLVRTFDLVPFKKMWNLLQSKDREQQLMYLLLKMYTGDEETAFEVLQKFPAADVLKAASSTWWPVEIDPLQKDGAYGWTTRAEKVDDNIALNVMKLSVVMPGEGNAADEGKWVHFTRAYRWIYIFRFPAVLQNDAVVYVDRLRKGDLMKWAANSTEILALGEGFVDPVRGVPVTARLPMARITSKESMDWHMGNPFEWARPFFPRRIADRLKFVPNKYPVPVVECPKAMSPTRESNR